MAQYELNVIDYWLILKKRKHLILCTASMVLLFTYVFSEFLKPVPMYEAAARVKFERSAPLAQQLLESLSYSSANDLATQIEFIRSFPVMERVAVDLQRVSPQASEIEKRSAEYLNAIYNLGQEITAKREGETNIIRIAVLSAHPGQAEQMANSVATAYRTENIAARNRLVTESQRYVREQVTLLENQLNDSEEALREFKEREGQVFLSDEARAALEAFTRLDEQRDEIQRKQAETERQIAALNRSDTALNSQSSRIFTEEQGALLTVMNQRLMDLIQERDTLLINYTKEHPQVVEHQRKIDNIKTEMTRELLSKTLTLKTRGEALQQQSHQYRQRYLEYPGAAIQMSRLERDVKVNADLLATLKGKHQELLIKGAERIEEVTIIAPAMMPTAPTNAPNVSLNFMIGALMGCFLGIALAFTRESFDTSIGTIEGVEELLKVPVLGIIPQFDHKSMREMAKDVLPSNTSPSVVESLSRLICLIDPKSLVSESLRSLRTNIQFASMNRPVRSIIFTSAGLGEGKSTCVINLAITMAQEGMKVLLVDADLRKPIVHQRLGLERQPGLSDALVGNVSWRSSVRSATDLMLGNVGVDRVINTPGLANLHVLTSGAESKNPNEFLNLNKIKTLTAEMQEEYDIVLIDTPPILPVTDAVAFSSRAEGTILVYQVGRIGRNALKRAKFLLDHAQANVMGVVLTNVKAEISPEATLYRYEYK